MAIEFIFHWIHLEEWCCRFITIKFSMCQKWHLFAITISTCDKKYLADNVLMLPLCLCVALPLARNLLCLFARMDSMGTGGLGQEEHMEGWGAQVHCLHHCLPILPWPHPSPRAKQGQVPSLPLVTVPSELKTVVGTAHPDKGSLGLSGYKLLHCPLP